MATAWAYRDGGVYRGTLVEEAVSVPNCRLANQKPSAALDRGLSL